MPEMTVVSPAQEPVVTLTRVFEAPRELVFEVWTRSEHLTNWWGPKGWTLPVSKMDFRPGGSWLFCMQGPNDEKSWAKIMYQEISAPERIVYTDSFADADGNLVEGLPESTVTLEFIDQGNKTIVVSTARYATIEARDAVINMGMVEGTSESMDRLDEYFKSL